MTFESEETDKIRQVTIMSMYRYTASCIHGIRHKMANASRNVNTLMCNTSAARMESSLASPTCLQNYPTVRESCSQTRQATRASHRARWLKCIIYFIHVRFHLEIGRVPVYPTPHPFLETVTDHKGYCVKGYGYRYFCIIKVNYPRTEPMTF